MSCQRHIQRKRPTSCPECAAELSKPIVVKPKEPEVVTPLVKLKANIAVARTKKEAKEEVVDVRTSRDALADMEKTEEEFVIKKERKKKEVVINTAEPKPEPVMVLAEDCASKAIKIQEGLIDKYLAEKLLEFRSKITSLSNVQYEHLSIPAAKCNMEMITTLDKDGWQYVDMYAQDNIIKVSGFTAPVAVFQRVKSDSRKKTVIEWKKELK